MEGTDTAFSAREATPADYALFTRLFPELGVSDPTPTAAQFVTRMLPRVLVVDENGAGVAYAFWQVYGRTAHVVHVVVDPRARGRGAGRVLMREVRARVRAEGCARWYLNVKQDNPAAIRLYERSGLAIEQEGWALDARWEQLAALPVAPSGRPGEEHAPFVPSAGDDEDIASRLDLLVERIAQLRARPGVVLLAMRDDHRLPVAFAAFDPAFPGVYPVRVTRVDLARPLFLALRTHARLDSVKVFVEGHRALYAALRAVGGQLHHALYRMGAPL